METVDKKSSVALRTAIVSIVLACLSALVVFLIAEFRDVKGVDFDLSTLFTAGIMVFIALFVLYLYIHVADMDSRANLVLVYSVQFITVLLCLLCLRYELYYAMPVSFCAFILGTDFDKQISIGAHISTVSIISICNVFFAYDGAEVSFDLMSLQVMTLVVQTAVGMSLIALIKRYANRIKIIGIALLVTLMSGLVGFAAAAAIGGKPDLNQMIITCGSLLASGAVSIILYFCLSPILERVFNLNTTMRLMELCSFDQPILKELAEKAPGTFNHSLTVANIAERAAYAIGANPSLARAAGLYHDIGKMENPEYFTENQTEGYNPHDDLILEASVKMITRHTDAGAKILEAKCFPKEIISAVLQHHGDSSVGYFYNKAKNITEGHLDSAGYTYEGPKPQTKINAIIMIADISEAATRSVRPSTREELANLVDKLVQGKINEHQFDDAPITFDEIKKVKQAVVNTLMGVFHDRISYNLGNDTNNKSK